MRFYCDETDRPLEKIEDPEIKELVENIATKTATRILKEKCIEIDDSELAYEEKVRSYKRTLEDDLFLLKIVEEDNFELKPHSRLAKLKNSLNSNLIIKKEKKHEQI